MPLSSTFGLQETLSQAPAVIADFESKVAAAPCEGNAVLFSEMLFLQATLADAKPPRIFESGRARGAGTSLLAACFPDAEIISVELDRNSLDVPVAGRNLAPFKNVRCLFGDAQQILPKMVQPGDAVIIDGPGHFRAVRLALRLLRDQMPCAVFIHDCHLGSVGRDFLAAAAPQAFYSDDEAFVKRFAHLDIKCWDQRKDLVEEGFRQPYSHRGRRSSYGPTLGCIPGSVDLNYPWLMLRLAFAELLSRAE